MRGSLFVNGQEVLHYPGSYDFKWAPGYQPMGWIGDDRYLVFSYNGYTNGTLAFLANVTGLGKDSGGVYLWDRQTGEITPFIDFTEFVWVP